MYSIPLQGIFSWPRTQAGSLLLAQRVSKKKIFHYESSVVVHVYGQVIVIYHKVTILPNLIILNRTFMLKGCHRIL